MSKVAVGSIPEKITYVFSEQISVAVGCEWDISWNESDDGPKTVKQEVTPAFPVDPSDEKTMKRAIQWASQDGWDFETKSRKTKKHDVQEIENIPVSNVKVLSLEHRGQGGRAYKAIIHDFYIDLREDVLMDTLLQVGVDPGGVLKGEYVWAKMGAQMKLVRVGSELHRLIVEFDSKKDVKPVGKGDLEIGGVYQDRKKNKAVFCGYVNTTNFKSEDESPSYNRIQKSEFKYKKTAVKKAMLFYELPSYEKMSDSLSKIEDSDKSYWFKIKKSHKYLDKVDQVAIPSKIVSRLRENALKEIKQDILKFVNSNSSSIINASQNLELSIEYKSSHLNLYVYGEKAIETFDVKKYLLFS